MARGLPRRCPFRAAVQRQVGPDRGGPLAHAHQPEPAATRAACRLEAHSVVDDRHPERAPGGQLYADRRSASVTRGIEHRLAGYADEVLAYLRPDLHAAPTFSDTATPVLALRCCASRVRAMSSRSSGGQLRSPRLPTPLRSSTRSRSRRSSSSCSLELRPVVLVAGAPIASGASSRQLARTAGARRTERHRASPWRCLRVEARHGDRLR